MPWFYEKTEKNNGYIKITLDKLPGIRADLVRLHKDWWKWEFSELIEALTKSHDRNQKIFHTGKNPK